MVKGGRSEALLISEVQLLLAEKRTYFAILRTGLGVITVPLTIIVFLLATKDYHNIFSYFWLGAIVIGALVAVSMAGIFIVIKSGHKLHKIDMLINGIEEENQRVKKLVIE